MLRLRKPRDPGRDGKQSQPSGSAAARGSRCIIEAKDRGSGLAAIIATAPAVGVESSVSPVEDCETRPLSSSQDIRALGWRSGRVVSGQAAGRANEHEDSILVTGWATDGRRWRAAIARTGTAHPVGSASAGRRTRSGKAPIRGEEGFVCGEMDEDEDRSGRDEAERPAVPV